MLQETLILDKMNILLNKKIIDFFFINQKCTNNDSRRFCFCVKKMIGIKQIYLRFYNHNYFKNGTPKNDYETKFHAIYR